MWRQSLSAVIVLGGCVGLAVFAAQADSGAVVVPTQTAFRPVAPVASLMYAQDVHYERLNALLVDDKEKDRISKIRNEAMILAELANVNHFNNDNADYRQWADEVRSASLELANAAEHGEFTAAKDLSKRINASCTACHKKYQ